MSTAVTTQSTPSTPVAAATPTISDNGPPGTWRHPRLDEINRRKNAGTFTDRNFRTVYRNAFLFVILFFVPFLDSFNFIHPASARIAKPLSTYGYYAYWWLVLVLRTLPLLRIAYACSPLLLPADDLSDIPLTPSQRALLGLEPTSKPPTPGSHYITPPRHPRSSTPRNSSGSQSGSPFSGNGSPGSGQGGLIGASYSPSASPLFHKAVGREAGRRNSLGTSASSYMSKSLGESSLGMSFNTPSPTNNRGVSVGLNSRWLYEKGRGSPGMRNVFS